MRNKSRDSPKSTRASFQCCHKFNYRTESNQTKDRILPTIPSRHRERIFIDTTHSPASCLFSNSVPYSDMILSVPITNNKKFQFAQALCRNNFLKGSQLLLSSSRIIIGKGSLSLCLAYRSSSFGALGSWDGV